MRRRKDIQGLSQHSEDEAGSIAAMTNMAYAPPEIVEHLKINAELVNMPEIGIAGNVAFHSNQLNISPVHGAEHGDVTMASAMGQFGVKHRDEHDAFPFFTHVTTVSNAGPNYDMGRFFLPYPGVFVSQNKFTSILFSGLRQHGGTPIIAPKEAPSDQLKRLARISLVSYTTNGSSSTNQSFALGAIPTSNKKASVLRIPPEFSSESDSPIKLECGHATYAQDGHVLANPGAHMKFIGRGIMNLAIGIIRQIEPALDPQVYSDQFLASISYVDPSTGVRHHLSPWKNGPGWRSEEGDNPPSQITSTRLVSQQSTALPLARSRWEAFSKVYSAHIPWITADKSKVTFPNEKDASNGDPPDRATTRAQKRSAHSAGINAEKPIGKRRQVYVLIPTRKRPL
ncbi:hypothetical protein BDN70DRAFT_939954 [Pholiota conissans]|uniref:Uncharacterized protein n=1 Tax=Pholiota conissans TaxID=109636 RepID=A0A9P6CL21_9AGAR|nr:hypothetical protein BDN70DRAFT_939954 [Pholiota conissans]